MHYKIACQSSLLSFKPLEQGKRFTLDDSKIPESSHLPGMPRSGMPSRLSEIPGEILWTRGYAYITGMLRETRPRADPRTRT